jgi:hypothetical protein
MGIRFYCPNGHKLHVKSFLAGKRGICPYCGVAVHIPLQSTRPSSKELRESRRQSKASSEDGARSPVRGSAGTAAGTLTASESQKHGPQPSGTPMVATPVGKVDSALPPEGSATSPVATSSDRGPPRAMGASPIASPISPGPAPRMGGAEGRAVPTAATGPRVAPGPMPGRSVFEPLDRDPTAVWYVMPPQGGRYGPASPAVMRTWLMEGRIGPDTLVWRSGWPDWQQAQDVFPNLTRFLETLASRLSAEEQLVPGGVRPISGPAVAGRPVQPVAPTSSQFLIPLIIAILIGGISIAMIVILILARAAG